MTTPPLIRTVHLMLGPRLLVVFESSFGGSGREHSYLCTLDQAMSSVRVGVLFDCVCSFGRDVKW